MSLVGFMFLNTRVMGRRIPGHVNFEESNLRFYVKYNDGKEWKRGAVFIKEIVPRAAITFIANTLHKEHYITLPMGHLWHSTDDRLQVEYSWELKGRRNYIQATAAAQALPIAAGSEEEFITEHYWGYTRLNDKATSEYQVEHPRWNVHPVQDFSLQCDAATLYGPALAEYLKPRPRSVFLADGSEIAVYRGGRI